MRLIDHQDDENGSNLGTYLHKNGTDIHQHAASHGLARALSNTA